MTYEFLQAVVYCGISVVFIMAEFFKPAKRLNLRDCMARDIIAALVAGIMFALAAYLLSDLYQAHLLYAHLKDIPVVIRVALFYLLADFGAYWIHRLMHTKIFWKTHWWHHAPKYIYWLSGARASAAQILLTSLPIIIAWPLMFDLPAWLYIAMYAELIFRNHWMHANVAIHSRFIEWVFITPTYHRVHHSNDSQYYNKNFAVLFTFWDRVFGTYQDPSKINKEFALGVHGKNKQIKMILGV